MINVLVEKFGTDKVIVKANTPFGWSQQTLNISQEEFNKGWEQHTSGALIQDAFPLLTSEEREFLLSGITPDEWNKLFDTEWEDE